MKKKSWLFESYRNFYLNSFLGRIKDIRRKDYIPNTQDILYCRVKTNSINKIEFTIRNEKKYGRGEPKFWMYDVGGQRGERRKWIQVRNENTNDFYRHKFYWNKNILGFWGYWSDFVSYISQWIWSEAKRRSHEKSLWGVFDSLQWHLWQ